MKRETNEEGERFQETRINSLKDENQQEPGKETELEGEKKILRMKRM